MNNCTLSGYTKNLSIKEKSGFFSLQVKEKGNEKDYISYITCKAFYPKIIENIKQFCVEGTFVMVTGRLATNNYEQKKEGVSYTVYETYVVVEKIEYQQPYQNGSQQSQQQIPQYEVSVQQQPYQQPYQQPTIHQQSGYQQPNQQYYQNYHQPQPVAVGGNNPPWQQ